MPKNKWKTKFDQLLCMVKHIQEKMQETNTDTERRLRERIQAITAPQAAALTDEEKRDPLHVFHERDSKIKDAFFEAMGRLEATIERAEKDEKDE